MKIGFGRKDITPRPGVELQGYGPYLCRHSDGVRDPLYARAAAFAAGKRCAVMVSCDIAGVSADITKRVRTRVAEQTDLQPDQVMVHAIHTHSGPATRVYSGWGTPDPPYIEILPYKIAQACIDAYNDLDDAVLSHAEVPCEGLGINREHDAFRAESVEDALREDWRPAKPELTDTTCHVFKVERNGKMAGFFSYFGCHPVVGGPGNPKIHGDYAGVATNLIERLHPGCTGFFLQGAQGDVNTAATACNEADTMRALDVLGARYARSVLAGLDRASSVDVSDLNVVSRAFVFSRKDWGRTDIEQMLKEREDILHDPEASDADVQLRHKMVEVSALRRMLAQLDRGESLAPPIEIQGFRIGPIRILATPFEVQRAIKNEFLEQAGNGTVLLVGLTNDSMGYAADRDVAARGGYAADRVPFICGQAPYANVHEELVQALLETNRALN